jgi:hypothetical protein
MPPHPLPPSPVRRSKTVPKDKIRRYSRFDQARFSPNIPGCDNIVAVVLHRVLDLAFADPQFVPLHHRAKGSNMRGKGLQRGLGLRIMFLRSKI